MPAAIFAVLSAALISTGAALADPAGDAPDVPVDISVTAICNGGGDANEPQDNLPADINAQLGKPENRIEDQDWSGQDLSGRDFKGKVLAKIKARKAKLRGADLTGAIICGSDFTDADFSGAHLDRVLIGGSSQLDNANLSDASARKLIIADVSYQNLRIDRADLREARLNCEAEGDLTRCLAQGGNFTSMTGADLRGATIDRLWEAVPGLGDAHLAGLVTQLHGGLQKNYVELARGVSPAGHMSFFPDYGFEGQRTDFNAEELALVPAVMDQMQRASAHPSFDCARATMLVEKAICASAKLSALDAALNWLWQRIEHTPERVAAQKTWLAYRLACHPPNPSSTDPFEGYLDWEPFAVPTDPKGCIGLSYLRRIRELAPLATPAAIAGGRYTTDAPLELPKGISSALAQKYLTARGYRLDAIILKDWGDGKGQIAGEGLWGNGHECGFESAAAETTRTGARVQVFMDPKSHDEQYSASFVVTPQVAIWVGGARQFQCGARGMWSNAYFRQPDALVAHLKGLQ